MIFSNPWQNPVPFPTSPNRINLFGLNNQKKGRNVSSVSGVGELRLGSCFCLWGGDNIWNMAIWKHLEKPLRLAAFPMLSFPEGQKGSIINKNQFKAFFLFVQDWLVAWLVGWLVGGVVEVAYIIEHGIQEMWGKDKVGTWWIWRVILSEGGSFVFTKNMQKDVRNLEVGGNNELDIYRMTWFISSNEFLLLYYALFWSLTSDVFEAFLYLENVFWTNPTKSSKRMLGRAEQHRHFFHEKQVRFMSFLPPHPSSSKPFICESVGFFQVLERASDEALNPKP